MKELLKKRHPFFIVFTLLALIFNSCTQDGGKLTAILLEQEDGAFRYEEIMKRGKIIAVTNDNSVNYFTYHGSPMGYEYEKLEMFADYLGVGLEIKTVNSLEESFKMLSKGECDVIARGVAITDARKKIVDFTDPHLQTRQVLVQRLPDNWRKMKEWEDVEKELIRTPMQLEGETIYVARNSVFEARLKNIMEETGVHIYIEEVDNKTMEDLITDVAAGKIKLTIADEYIAGLNADYYHNIDVKTPLSLDQNLAWAVKKGADSLVNKMNLWLAGYRESLASKYLVKKYFENSRTIFMAKNEDFSSHFGKISKYDDIIKKVSMKYGIDWLLVSSLVYQESQFDKEGISHKGAFGLMQMIPATARLYDIDSLSSEAEQIDAGVRYFISLDAKFSKEIKDPDERVKFALAAYNAGIAHVFDARRLAEKFGKDPNKWTDNVDYYLRNKSNPKFYQDDVVRYGYAHGEETFNFVVEVLERYMHYMNVIED